ncbi:hypothetical protein HNQ56_003124 [Anaerotaenia torta]|uniref:lytic transglycosylase domain-containing protein n=1 Tax=Anaerotaenia torta TaxID=433293 RepID=UPI003D1AC5A7
MAEVSGIANVENRNAQSISPVKRNNESTEFSSFLGETKSLDEIFQNAAVKYNVTVELLKAIGKAESDFNPKAVSRCGAQGVMQLMPGTAKELGVTDSFDAEQNIMGGAKYIAQMLKKYDGDTKLALAAYNAGSNNVAKYGGIPPFKETQNYVKKVMNYVSQGTDTKGIRVSTGTGETGGTIQAGYKTAAPAPVQNNYAFLIAQSVKEGGDLESLEAIFSYDDYLKFLELFLKEQEESKEQEEEVYREYAKEIAYSVPVMSLLRDQENYNAGI